MQEYDLDIKHMKLVRGIFLCKATTEGSYRGEEETKKEIPLFQFIDNVDDRFLNISYFLTYGECPAQLSPK